MMKAGLMFLLVATALASSVDPIQKVVQMLSDLEGKIVGEGTAAQKVYDEFSEFCEDRSRNIGFEIKTGHAEVNDLTATIAKEAATADSLNAKIEELSGAIATDEADLKAATEIRAKEQGAFEAEEKELVEVISTLQRATGILEREMAKTGSASMLQLQNAQSVVQALTVMVSATSLSSADAKQLSAFFAEHPGC
jgi:hypothetical protein